MGAFPFNFLFHFELDSLWDKGQLRKRDPLFSLGQPRENKEPSLESSFSLTEGARSQRDLLFDCFHLEQKASIDGSATIDGDRVR